MNKRIAYLAYIIIGAGLIAGAYFLLQLHAQNVIEKKLAAIGGTVDQIDIALATGSVTFHRLEIFPSKSLPCNVKLRQLKVKGLSIFRFIRNGDVKIKSLLIDSGTIRYYQRLRLGKRNSNRKARNISVGTLEINNVVAEVWQDTSIRLTSSLKINVNDLQIDKRSAITARSVNLTWDKIKFEIDKFYRCKLRSVVFDSERNRLKIDSIQLIPQYSKFDFAHVAGKQADRIDLLIPQLTVDGINLESLLDSALIASTLTVRQMDIHAFKDKRMPFLKTKVIPLPMESLIKLPWKIEIDSISLSDAHIEIEEFSPNGDDSGTIIFENVNATLTGLNNRSNSSNNAILNATGLLMGIGKIDAKFTLPLQLRQHYNVEGTISNLPLTSLNTPLKELANVRFETGGIDQLSFQFNYDNLKSNGLLKINYKDVHMIALQKKDDSPSALKTFLLNTVVKSNKNKEKIDETRTGEINFERNQQKFIFNYWWKSILSGIKSATLSVGKKKDEK